MIIVFDQIGKIIGEFPDHYEQHALEQVVRHNINPDNAGKKIGFSRIEHGREWYDFDVASMKMVPKSTEKLYVQGQMDIDQVRRHYVHKAWSVWKEALDNNPDMLLKFVNNITGIEKSDDVYRVLTDKFSVCVRAVQKALTPDKMKEQVEGFKQWVATTGINL